MGSAENHHIAPGSRFDPSAGGRETLPGSWAAHWKATPERPALRFADGTALSYGELEAASRRAAGRLHSVGLGAGDRVLFSAGSSAHGVVAHVACLRLGLVVIPANTAYREAEVAHVVGDARPSAAIVDEPQRGEWIRAAADIPVLTPDLPLDEAPAPALDQSVAGAPALIGYTSGTTGRPKGAVLSHGNLLSSVEALRLAWRWSSDDRLVLALPLFHMHGLGVGLHGTLHAGASAMILPRFDPDEVLDAAAAFDATLFFGVPTLYHRLMQSDRVSELARLRLCVSGSAPLPAELHARFEAQTGQRIIERYGMTETVMLVSNPVEGERRPGTVGLPLPGVEMRLVGEPPEIEVRGPNVFAGYLGRPDANAEAFREDGFFRTGDLGHLDEAGYLCIAGRARELLISGGYNVYPREVEEALGEHPEIVESAVVGTPSQEWGDAVTAYLVPRPGAQPTVAEVRNFLGEKLAPFKHPRTVYCVEALPRNALGKVQKHRLKNGRILDEEAD